MPNISDLEKTLALLLVFALGCAKPQTAHKHYWDYWSGSEDIHELYLFPHNSLSNKTTLEREEINHRYIKLDPDWAKFKMLIKDGDELWSWEGGGKLVTVSRKDCPNGGSPFGVCLIRGKIIIAIFYIGILTVT